MGVFKVRIIPKRMNHLPDLLPRYKQHLPLLLAVLVAAPVVFFQAFRYSFPLGYAGMFTLIAERIAGADFRLPMSIPHYGPGGIPLIYPPFAMYVFALASPFLLFLLAAQLECVRVVSQLDCVLEA